MLTKANISSLFLAFVFSVSLHSQKSSTVAKNGYYILEPNSKSENVYWLEGDWAFYKNSYLTEKPIIKPDTYLNVPGWWNDLMISDENPKGFGYGTFFVTVKGLKPYRSYSLKFNTAGSSMKAYVNGNIIGEQGVPGTNAETTVPFYKPFVASFTTPTDSAVIAVQVANFSHREGGMWYVTLFGESEQVNKIENQLVFAESLLFGAFLIMAFYHLYLWWLRRKVRTPLYFGIFTLLLGSRILFTGEFLINTIIEVPWIWQVKADYITYFLTISFFCGFINSLYKQEFNRTVFLISAAIPAVVSTLVIFLPEWHTTKVITYMQIYTVIVGIYLIYVMSLAAIRNRDGAKLLVFGFVFFFLTVINDVLYHQDILKHSLNLFGAGLFTFVMMQAMALAIRFNNSFAQTENLTIELNYINKNLEKIVADRTNALTEANNILQEQNEEILQQKEELTVQRDEIELQRDAAQFAHMQIVKQNQKITDSISYASRIQSAVVPPNQLMHQLFNNLIIFNRPKDLISGDFYWSKVIDEKIVLAVADSTGHGVPGAFMSLLGITMLAESVGQMEELKAGDILGVLRNKIIDALQQNNKTNVRDGMDVALLVINHNEKIIQFSGAHNSLIIIRNNEILEFKGDAMPIGLMRNQMKRFTNHYIHYKENDQIYLFTDGYYDQIGGEFNRKFMKKNFKNLLLTMHKQPAAQQLKTLEKTHLDWKGNNEQVDDVLIVGFSM